MLTSEQLDAAIKHEIARHIAGDDSDGARNCLACDQIWPCDFLIQASISLKLTAMIGFLSGEFSVNQLMGGIAHGAQGNRHRFQGPKV